MAVLDSNQTVSNNVSGFEKKIQSSATTMMLDNLQSYMYQKPIPSAVRECVSNAIDSVKEKNTAVKILKGEANVRDHYLTREDVKDKVANAANDIYEDSEFNSSYYDLKWLNTNDTVVVKYVTTEQTKRDRFVITDPGVGLGGLRLEGFFNLGYSSKRLNTNELGGFGLGAKSPLATGVESYRIISRYNGMEFCFDIYSHKVDCVYSKWNEDGTTNNYYEFQTGREPLEKDEETGLVTKWSEGFKAYYKDTTEKNGVTLIIDVKKHNRPQYFEAVKSQLMYLRQDIKFYEENTAGYETEIAFKANILYSDDEIVLSDYNYYTRPHFVIKDVGYGVIDFDELDLAQKVGNIGIRVKMEDIQVTPSRETVIYSTKTRDAVLKQYEKVSKTVESKIQEALNQTDLVEWLRACGRIMYSSGNSSDIITRLSSLIDKSSLKPKFKRNDTTIAFSSDVKSFVTPLLHVQHKTLTMTYNRNKNRNEKKLGTSDADSITIFDRPMFLQFSTGSARTTSYLSGIYQNNGGYGVIRVNTAVTYIEETLHNFSLNKISREEAIAEITLQANTVETDSTKAATIIKNAEKVLTLVQLLKESPHVEIYSEVAVPDTFKMGDTASEDDDDVVVEDQDFEAIEQKAREDAYKKVLQRRKENKIFIANTLCNKRKSSYSYESGYEKREVKVADLDFDETEIVYGTDDDAKTFEMLMDLESSYLGSRTNTYIPYYWNDKVKMLKVAKGNLKFVKDGTHVNDYVIRVDDNCVLTAAGKLKDVFTAAAIKDTLTPRCEFMTNFREFSPEIANTYNSLQSFKVNQASLSTVEQYQHPIAKTLVAAYKVQLEFLKHPSIDEDEKQEIIHANIPQDLDLDILDIDLIDVAKYNEAVKLAAFADAYGSILSYITPLSNKSMPIMKPELIIEIRNILDSRKDQLEYQYENIN